MYNQMYWMSSHIDGAQREWASQPGTFSSPIALQRVAKRLPENVTTRAGTLGSD